MISTLLISLGIITICTAGAVATYYISRRTIARRDAKRMSKALSVCYALFTALEHVPDARISRDLRRGLVLLITHHLEVLGQIAPRHLHLADLQHRVQKLNRMPSGLQRDRIRSKTDRQLASSAFEEMARLLNQAYKDGALKLKDADLAAAAAKFAAQQIAVDSARQASKDAENIRAYRQALNFAYQAQALCRRLPPLMGNALSEAVATDVERLEEQVGVAART